MIKCIVLETVEQVTQVPHVDQRTQHRVGGQGHPSISRPEGKVVILCNIVLSIFPLYYVMEQHVILEDPGTEPAGHLGRELSLLLMLIGGEGVEGSDWVRVARGHHKYTWTPVKDCNTHYAYVTQHSCLQKIYL